MIKILAFRLPEFEKKIAAFNKKATKWNLPLITYQVIQEGVEERQVAVDEDHNPIMAKLEFKVLEIQGAVPRLDGWSIHSKVQPSDIAGQNYVFTTQGHEPREALRTCPLFCDHCQSRRLKKNAYWIVNEDGRQMMVGATCLKDFLPTIDVDALLGYMNNIAILSAGDDDWDGPVGSQWWVYYTADAIMDAYVAIKKYGFTSKAKAEEQGGFPTSDSINMSPKAAAELYKGVDVEKLQIELEGFIPHMMAKSTVGNDFIHNVQLILQSKLIRPKLYGYLAAAVSIWMKELADVATASPAVSEWQGVVGARLNLKGLRITRIHVSEGMYGDVYTTIMQDEAGNRFVWYASKKVGSENDVINLAGTVKKHDEFRGQKQTQLTRCRVI